MGVKRLLSFSLVPFLHQRNRASARGMDGVGLWLAEYLRRGRALASGAITQAAWQDRMGRLFTTCEPAALLEWIDFDAVSTRLKRDAQGRGELFYTVLVDGMPLTSDADPEPVAMQEPGRVVLTHIAYVEKGCSIPPHGHRNMVSAFLLLSGEFRVRQYDKLDDEGDALVIRPTMDARAGAGGWSTSSDLRNNVHWLTAESDDCYLFSTKLIGLADEVPCEGRINVDIPRAARVGGGALRAPRIDGDRVAELAGCVRPSAFLTALSSNTPSGSAGSIPAAPGRTPHSSQPR